MWVPRWPASLLGTAEFFLFFFHVVHNLPVSAQYLLGFDLLRAAYAPFRLRILVLQVEWGWRREKPQMGVSRMAPETENPHAAILSNY
jgi:hypothetical protein